MSRRARRVALSAGSRVRPTSSCSTRRRSGSRSMADAAMIPWSPEVLEGAQPVQPAQAFSPLTTVAQGIQELKAKQAELQRARAAEQAPLAASAAAQRPKIEAAQTALAQPMPTPPTAPPITEPPSRGLTPFLAPIDGEPAETS